MAGVQIGLILLFLFFFILTSTVWIRLIKYENFRIEFHLPLLAFFLTIKGKEKKKQTDTKRGVRSYLRIFTAILKHLEDCTIEIEKITLPCKTDDFSQSTLVTPFSYQGLIYAILLRLKAKIKRLKICDNAIISSPDIEKAHLRITIKARLYQVLYALYMLKRKLKNEHK